MRGIIAVLLLIFGIKWGFNLLGPLAWVLLVVLAQFGPGRDSIGEKGVWKYKHDEEYNHLNPLYVRGYFRKGANKSSLFSNLKGFFVCQILSLVLLVPTLISLLMKFMYRSTWQAEKILIIASFVLLFIEIVMREYYQMRYSQHYRYTENEEGIWQPFLFLYLPSNRYGDSRSVHRRYDIPYEDLKENLKPSAEAKGYIFSDCLQGKGVEEFNLFTRMDEEKLDILALIHVEILEEESWETFNDLFEAFWKEKIAGKYETKQMTFSFLLCVEEGSKELRKTHRRMETVDSKFGRYRLAALLDYSDQCWLDIPEDYRKYSRDKRRGQIRNEMIEMLKMTRVLSEEE